MAPDLSPLASRVHTDVDLRPGNGLGQPEQLGAKVLHPFGSIPDARCAFLADPEGNEFCVVKFGSLPGE